MTPTEITKKLDCTKSNLTQRLNHLEKNGLIRRVRHPAKGDGRTVGIALTDSGRRKILEATQILRKHGALLESRFSIAEKRACHEFLKKVNQILDPYGHTAPCSHR
jgi:DNA-binding MarR family transcriptional regulator